MKRLNTISLLLIPIIVGAVVLIAGQAWIRSLPDVYESQSRVGFFPKVDDGPIPGSETVVLSANNFVAFVSAPATISAAAKKADMSAEELEDGLTASVTPGSATLVISVETEDSDASAEAANALTTILLEAAKEDKVVEARRLAGARPSANPSGPPRTVLSVAIGVAAIGAFILLLGVLVLALRWRATGGIRASVDRMAHPEVDVAPGPRPQR